MLLFSSLSRLSNPHRSLLLLSIIPSAARGFFTFGHPSNMPFVTERDGKGTIVVSPKNEKDQNALVVISHGLGDSAEGFADVAEHFATQMPHIKFILPTAPTQPVTMNMGMSMPSWYDIIGLDERSNENCKGIEESQARLTDILRHEHEQTGLPYNRMVLAGFSQGGALSLFTGMQLEQGPLAGIAVMSGYIPAAPKFKMRDGNKNTPVLHCHGTNDPLVLYPMANKSKEFMTQQGATNYKIRNYPIEHTVSPQELADVVNFLREILPPDDACAVRVKEPSEMSVKELKAAIRKAGLGSKAVGLMEKTEFVQLLTEHRAGKM